MKTKRHLSLAVAAIGAAMAFSAHAQVGGGSDPSTSPSSGPGSSSSPASPSAPGADLGKLDTNKDGTISKSEARRDKQLSKAFASLDANHDGKLDAAEFAAYSTGDSSMGGAKP